MIILVQNSGLYFVVGVFPYKFVLQRGLSLLLFWFSCLKGIVSIENLHCNLRFFFVTAIYFITVIACSLLAFPATHTTVRNRSQHFITYAIYFLFTRFATDFYPFCCQGDCMHAKGLCLLWIQLPWIHCFFCIHAYSFSAIACVMSYGLWTQTLCLLCLVVSFR